VDDPAFDLSEHLHVQPLADSVGETELLLESERLRRQRLDPSRPLWEMWFMPGLPDKRIALFVKIHHAIADGMAAMATVGAFLDADPAAPPASARPWTPASLPSSRDLLADNVLRRLRATAAVLSMLARPRATLRQLLAALPAMRELFAEQPTPKTSLDRVIGPDRNLALARSRSDLVKEVAHAYGATVNDVLLAVIAGGLRALLRSRREPVENLTVRICVPVSLRSEERGALQGNLISQMVVPLPLGVSNPSWRLQQIAAETTQRKTRSRIPLGKFFRGGIVERLLLKAVIRQRVNVTSTNLHGPELPLYLAGHRCSKCFHSWPSSATRHSELARCLTRERSTSVWSATATRIPTSMSWPRACGTSWMRIYSNSSNIGFGAPSVLKSQPWMATCCCTSCLPIPFIGRTTSNSKFDQCQWPR
jgi:WS/DGAT/MGAT family acyltransferase